MRKSFKEQAEELYKDASAKVRKKKIDAAILIDNRLKLEYTPGGHTNCFFDVAAWLFVFDE